MEDHLLPWLRTLEEATWADISSVKDQLPSFNLKDKVVSEQGGIVVFWILDKPLQLYYRRKKGLHKG